MNPTSTNYCLDSLSRRSSLCPPTNHQHENPVLSPPLTPALSQHHPFDKRQSSDLTYSPNPYHPRSNPTPNTRANNYTAMDNYHHWMDHSASIQQQQQAYHHQMQQPMHHHQQSPIPSQHPLLHHSSVSFSTTSQQQQLTSTAIGSNTNRQTTSRKKPLKQNKHMCTYPDCLWSFKRFEHLKRHKLVHTGERPHVCPHPGCGKRFSRSDNFHAHHRTHEKKAIARQRQQQKQASSTSTCSSTVANPSASHFLPVKVEQKDTVMHPYYHQQQHQPSTYPLLANPASKQQQQHTFMNCHSQQQENYMTHGSDSGSNGPFYQKQQHNSESPTPSNALSHLQETSPGSPTSSSSSSNNSISPKTKQKKTTTGDQKKTHACNHPSCDRRFRRLEHLKRHIRIHTHEQPFQCNFSGCLKAFSRSDNLTQHRKTHERKSTKYNNSSSTPLDHQQQSQQFSMQQQQLQPSSSSESFALADFIRADHTHHHYNNTATTAAATDNKSLNNANTASFHDNTKQHSLLGWQHPGDTSTESVGC